MPKVSAYLVDGVKRMPSEPVVVGRPDTPRLSPACTLMGRPVQGSMALWPSVVPPPSCKVLPSRP